MKYSYVALVQLLAVKVGVSTRYDLEDLDGFITTNRCRDRTRSV